MKVPPIGHFDPDNVLGCPGMQYAGPDAPVWASVLRNRNTGLYTVYACMPRGHCVMIVKLPPGDVTRII